MDELYRFLIEALVVWRLTHLLHAEAGPWRVLRRLRTAVAARFRTSLFDCFYCLSLWIAAPAAWLCGSSPEQRLVLWLALSGGAIVIERMSEREIVAPAPYVESEPET